MSVKWAKYKKDTQKRRMNKKRQFCCVDIRVFISHAFFVSDRSVDFFLFSWFSRQEKWSFPLIRDSREQLPRRVVLLSCHHLEGNFRQSRRKCFLSWCHSLIVSVLVSLEACLSSNDVMLSMYVSRLHNEETTESSSSFLTAFFDVYFLVWSSISNVFPSSPLDVLDDFFVVPFFLQEGWSRSRLVIPVKPGMTSLVAHMYSCYFGQIKNRCTVKGKTGVT